MEGINGRAPIRRRTDNRDTTRGKYNILGVDNLVNEDVCDEISPQNIHRYRLRTTVFLIITLDAANFIISWLYYRDVLHIEKGLVQGPPVNTVKHSLLAFSIIGSATVVFEVINLWRELFSDKPWVDTIISSAITVWTEDVPQLVIIFYIAASREEAVGYSQFLKAAISMLSVAIRMLHIAMHYCYNRNASKKSFLFVVFLSVGSVVCVSAATSVFVTTRMVTHVDADTTTKYFRNTGVFFSYYFLDTPAQPPYSEPNMIKLTDVETIINGSEPGIVIQLTLMFYRSSRVTTVSLSNTNGILKGSDECFDSYNKTLKVLMPCTSFYPSQQIFFFFQYTKPRFPGLLFGDIKYNILTKQCGLTGKCSCNKPDFVIGDDIQKRNASADPAIQFFRYNETNSFTSIVRPNYFPDAAYYKPSQVQDVTSLWTSGFANTKTSGTISPTFDTSLMFPCFPYQIQSN